MKGLFKKIHNRKLVLIIMIAAFISVMIVSAKYVYNRVTNNSAITSDQFYFTTDITGDDYMVSQADGSYNVYQYNNVQSGDFYLYGGGTHTIEISIRNFDDELRVTKKDIEYQIDSSNLVSVTKINETDTIDENKTFTLNKGSNSEDKYTLTIGSDNYKDEAKATVTIESTKPYEKTITLNFTLYTTDSYACYQVKDSVGSPYAELIMMANNIKNVDGITNIKPTIEWDTDELSIDNTNTLTYNYNNNGSFTQQSGMEKGSMIISKALNSKESASIYFFKSDVSQDYSTGSVKNIMANNGSYIINISNSKATDNTTTTTEGGGNNE